MNMDICFLIKPYSRDRKMKVALAGLRLEHGFGTLEPGMYHEGGEGIPPYALLSFKPSHGGEWPINHATSYLTEKGFSVDVSRESEEPNNHLRAILEQHIYRTRS